MIVKIRKEELKDQEVVYDLVEDAFDSELEADLVRLFDISKNGVLSLVAEVDNKVVGYILLSQMSVFESNDDIKIYSIGPMAVDPEYQQNGIGTKLVNEIIKMAKNSGVDAIFVLGHNSYYPKFGFVSTEDYDIVCEYDVPPEVFMVLGLTDKFSTIHGKEVRYAKEFGQVF